MHRRNVVLITGALLALGIAVPTGSATAAPWAPSPPAPVHVTVASGATNEAVVSWSAPRSRARITGYVVSLTPPRWRHDHAVDRVGPAVRTDRFGGLTAGHTYTISVQTVARHAISSPVRVAYTAPLPTPPAPVESLFGLDASGALLRMPVAGGPVTTITANGAGYDVDAAGNAYVPTDDGTTITRYPAGGGTPSVVATGLAISGGVQLDAAGDLYFDQDGSFVERSADSATVRAIGPSTSPEFVAPDGAVTLATGSEREPSLTTYPADGSAPRVIPFSFSFPVTVLGGTSGDLFVEVISSGGSGALSWIRVPAGSTTPESIGRLAYSAPAVNAAGKFFLLQSATWCAGPSEALGDCTPDRSVPEVQTFRADGTTTTTPISGLTIGAPNSSDPEAGAADAAGDVFVSIPSGPSAGLVEVPAAGGPVIRLDDGQYTRLMVNTPTAP